MSNMRKLNHIICSDKYEREKLTSLFSIQKDDSVFVMDVENLIDNEIIIKLKDKSCHSITLKNKDNANSLFLLIKEIKINKMPLSEFLFFSRFTKILLDYLPIKVYFHV